MASDGESPAAEPAVIRLLLAEDMHMVRQALVALLNVEPDLEVVAEAADGRSAVDEAIRHRPDVAVVDLDMPVMDGMQVTAELARTLPSCAVVILTGLGSPGTLRRALLNGAKGFVSKDANAAVLAEVIRKVRQGDKYVDPSLAAAALVLPPCPLTPGELQVLRLAENGTPAAEIARRASLSAGTVRNYLAAAVSKLGVTTRSEAFRLAHENDWL